MTTSSLYYFLSIICLFLYSKSSFRPDVNFYEQQFDASVKHLIFFFSAPPEVTLNDGIAAVFHKYTEIIATIRSFPKHSSVIWKKGEDIIDITLPKYAGSLFDGNHLILYIANVEEEDEDVYTIEVQNEKGIATCSRKVVVLGGKINPNSVSRVK